MSNHGAPSELPWQPSERLLRLRDDHLAAPPAVGLERAFHYTDFHKRHARTSSSAQLLAAGCLADHLERRTIHIYPGERIVGTHTEHRIGAICQVERAGTFMLEDLLQFDRRPVNPLRVPEGAKRRLLTRVIPYWLNRNLATRAFGFPRRLTYAWEQLNAADYVINEAGGVAHFLPDYGRIVSLGTTGLRRRIRDARAAIGEPTESQAAFFGAGERVLDALELFADRYRAEAERVGRADLVALLERIPRQPAETLHEALQMIWFFQAVIQIESLDQGISLGRMDAYLYEVYERERHGPGFDRDELRDVIGEFCLKLSSVIPLFSRRITEYFGGLPTGQAITLGGTDGAGRDAANELTFLFLDVLEGFATRQPNWHARIAPSSDPEFVRRAIRIIARGGGSPALYNDDIIVPALEKRGIVPEEARGYATVGCVEPALPGVSFTSSDAAIFNVAADLPRVLQGDAGVDPKGIRDMDGLLAALERSLEQRVGHLKRDLDAIERSNAVHFPTPFSSLTIAGCIDSGTDATRGGARYNASGIQGVGIADLADSLAVIQELVFERQEVTLERVTKACATNFEKDRELRARALQVVKFGNDEPRVDDLARRVAAMFDRAISRHTSTRGGPWVPGAYSMTCHQGFGKHTGALPSGRLAGEPLADGIAPVDGTDCLGPTASLNSVTRVDTSAFANGVNLNVKFDARTVATGTGRAALEGLMRGYFAQGGMQIQINVLDRGVLEEAMIHPDRHRNLLVRISGYCAYFADLTPEMQLEIIKRTEQRAS